MSENKEKKPVAIVKRACRICGKIYDGEILLARNVYTDLSNMDGAVVGWLKEPCDQCKNWMQQGVIFIGVDVEKTTDETNPYRSGDFSVIRDSSQVFSVINEPERSEIIRKRSCFIDYRLGYQLGVFRHPESVEPTNPDAD